MYTVEGVIEADHGPKYLSPLLARPMSGIFGTLVREHAELIAGLQELAARSSADERAELFPDLAQQLLAHELAETEVLSPHFASRPELCRFTGDHRREAAHLERVLGALRVTRYDDAEWAPTLGRLTEMLQFHVAREQGLSFVVANVVLADRGEELRAEYERCKAAALLALG